MASTVDLRTYLLLERAFVRRLQRSWRQQSAPIYEKITQACLDHRWDEARRLVPELDMAEVGTENREWITYMLLSCAVFGAGTVAKRKPSFVGVGTFDTFLKQVTNNLLMYLEYTATAQVQEEALQSIAEDEAKTKALKVAFDPHQLRDEKGRWAGAGRGGTGEGKKQYINGLWVRPIPAGRYRVYHGTKGNFEGEAFRVGKEHEIWFTTDRAEAEGVAGETGTVIEAEIDLKHPVIAEYGISGRDVQKKGFDSFLHPHGDVPENKAYRRGEAPPVAFDVAVTSPTQITIISRITKPPGIGGITRKFDEAKHPRDKDGRFREATHPRIFNRPSEVGELKGWPGDPVRYGWIEEGRVTGRLLTGLPIPREQIPAKLYHVTTNAPAVESSGVLLGQQEDTGLGGGQAEGVSFTSSREDAMVIQRELKRAVRVARGEDRIEDLDRYAREDEQMAGLSPGTLDHAVQFAKDQWVANQQGIEHTFVWDKDLPEDKRGYVGPPPPPEEQERLRRSSMNDALKAYLQIRGHHDEQYPLLKNPILFGRQEHLAKLNPDNIQILETEAEDIPADALVTTGSDKFLHEVRVYADVPRRRKIARDYVREPAGTSEGGQFAETGRSGVPTPDPVLAVQAKAGIAAVEKLIPQAIQTADFSKVSGAWEDLNEASREKVRQKYEEKTYDYTSEHLNTYDLDHQVRSEVEKQKGAEIREATVKRVAFDYEGVVDPATIHATSTGLLRSTLLRRPDGTPLNDYETDLKNIQQSWREHYNDVWKKKVEEYQDTDEYLARREKLVLQSIGESWKSLDPQRKMEIATEMRLAGELQGNVLDRVIREPTHWVTGVETGTHGEDNYARTHAIASRLTVMRMDELRQERGLLGLKDKPPYEIKEIIGQPDTDMYIGFSGTKLYQVIDKTTGAIVTTTDTEGGAISDAEEWAEQNRIRGGVKSEEVIHAVWGQWIRKSGEGLSLSLQLAAARELGGHHRMTPLEVAEAESEARPYGGMETLQAYVRAQWEVTQTVMAKAGQDKVSVYRGLMLEGKRVEDTTNLRLNAKGEPISPPTNITEGIDKQSKNPYVSFDYNGEHFVAMKEQVPWKSILEVQASYWHQVEKETQEKVYSVWRTDAAEFNLPEERVRKLFEHLGDASRFQLMQDYVSQGKMEGKIQPVRPFESTESVVQRRLTAYFDQKGLLTKLPDLQLRRAGAQSTTGTQSVANNWGGVGDNPPDAKRVVLRIEAPSTSVLSLPVYGENSQEEHESVLMGTKDKWVWDAWRDRAPDFEKYPVTGRPPASHSLVEWSEPVDYDEKMALKREPLIVDLQAEDRDKPHWMSSVNWQTVVKWDEAKHPRDKDGQFTEGVGTRAAEAQKPDARAGGSGGVAVSTSAKAKGGGRPEAVPEVQAVADAYNAKHGLSPVQHDYAKLDEVRAGTIADAYDALPLDDSGNPEVRVAYEALATEIRQQFDHIVASGVTFTPWTKEGQPYQNSTDMVDDIRKNTHMFFYTGGDPNPFMAARDPETGLTTNDMFRAVHDYFGHAAGGYGFGPRGEENAWMSHSQMLTPQARRALTTETRGQNSWVNFGRHNYDAEGNHKNIPPQDRPFATQKTALLPEWYVLLPGESTLKWDESQHPRDEDGQFTRVAMTSQRPEGDPGHQPNKEVFRHMQAFQDRLEALPGVSKVSVKPGVGGWEGGSESMWQIYYKGNGEARKLVARTAKAHNQDAVLILNKCNGTDCQPAVELSFEGAITPTTREHIHQTLVDNGIGGWTWMKRNGKTLLRMVCVPQWGGEADKHQQATVEISRKLRENGLKNHRSVHKVAVSVMEREGYDAIIGS